MLIKARLMFASIVLKACFSSIVSDLADLDASNFAFLDCKGSASVQRVIFDVVFALGWEKVILVRR